MRYIAGSSLGFIAAVVLLAACGGPPADNPLLQDAAASYEAAAGDTQVVSKAPVALEEAEEALLRAQRFWQGGANREDVDHHAYLASQRVRIAQKIAALNAAEEEIQRAEVERKEVQLKARAAEAERAERRAEESLRQAEQARGEAEQAAARAEELTRRVEELEAERTERGLILTLGDVLFDVGRADLKPGAMTTIDKLADFLEEYPERNVLIEGHTDITGSLQTNMELSRRRAEAVRLALLERGVADRRLRTQGLGPQYPVASNDDAAGRQRNRRVEVIISDRTGVIAERP